MDENEIRKALSDLPLRGLKFFAQTGSTNEDAKAWAGGGASDSSLVYAEEQTRGRGRRDRKWSTPPGCALAFSLVIRPREEEVPSLPLFSALGALSVCEALGAMGLHPEIKWPNDVLLGGRKFCGVLAEAIWLNQMVECVILGVGVNVTAGSVPSQKGLTYPATCLEEEAGRSTDRLSLLHEILVAYLYWRPMFASSFFLSAWEQRLAFRGQQVEIRVEGGKSRTGRLEGLNPDGSLRLRSGNGRKIAVQFGEVHLRPLV